MAYNMGIAEMTLPISVIIPVYNQGRWLEAAFNSALEADADQIIVCVDASQDDSEGIARRLCKGSNNHLEFVTPIRAGVCFSRNYGILHAKNDLIFPLDADDRLYPDGLLGLYKVWQPGTWVYGDSYTEIDENEVVIRDMQNPPPGMIYRKNLTYSSFLFSKLDWVKAGYYNPDFEPLEEDYSFQCALVNAGVKAVRVDNCLLYKRMIHTNSRTAKAMKYWNVTLEMCKERYPGAFIT